MYKGDVETMNKSCENQIDFHYFSKEHYLLF